MARNGKKKTQKQKSLPFIQPDAAGIDIGATEIYVAVPEERDIRPVRKFATFTEDLHALGRLAHGLFNQNGGHGIDRSLLDRPFPDPGAPGFGSLPGQRPPYQRGAGSQNRHPGLPVAAIPPQLWDCCEDLFGLRKPFVPFAVSCATATTSSRAPRAKCCSCKKPSPR